MKGFQHKHCEWHSQHLSIFWYQITSNKHVTINKGEYIGHLENIVEEENPYPHENYAHTSKQCYNKNILEQVEPEVFEPPHHKLKPNIKAKLEGLLKEYESQFMRDETTIGTTPLTKMSMDTGNSEPLSQKSYPIAMKHYQWVKDEIENLPTTKMI